MKKIIIVIIIAVVVIGGVLLSKKSSNDTYTGSDNGTMSSTTNTMASTTVMKEYAMSEIAMHKDSTSCWTTINGKVFDLTAWISKHPGGDKAILSICGIDGTKAFESQHGGQKKPEMKLESFKIGTLSTK